MSLKSLVSRLENKEITPLDLVNEAIEKIDLSNDKVNAVVNTRYEKAKAEAILDYSNTVYKGIPILIKSIGQDLVDEPSTSASVLFKDNVSLMTDNFVQKILDLGFIVIGQTTGPEFAFKNTSDSLLHGDVSLFDNEDYSSGGSSGGSASALQAGFTPVTAASDGGGSIRIPASYAGLVGLKPTRGAMPVGPNGYRGWQGASVNFFLTNNVDDTVSLFENMKTVQIESPFTYVENSKVKDKLKIAYSLDSPVGLDVSDDAKAALEKTVKLLEDLGHTVEYKTPEFDGARLMETYYMVNGVETAAMFENIEAAIQRDITIDDMELMSWVMYQYGKNLPSTALVHGLNFWDHTAAVLHKFHKEYDLYLTPTTAYTAPRNDQEYQSEELLTLMRNVEFEEDKYQILWDQFKDALKRTPYTMLANITGQPAISLPLYKNDDNLFLGSMFMAEKGNEKLLFEIAKQLEEHFVQN